MEEWKDINTWENLYKISNYGNVRNKKTMKMITGDVNNCGYYRVRLYSNGRAERFFRHRLVAMHFIENPENKKFVNHIDGDKSNNKYTNLEWVTQSENEKHAFKKNLKSKTNKPIKVIFNNGEEKIFDNQYILADEIGTTQASVFAWLSGRFSSYHKFGIKELYII